MHSSQVQVKRASQWAYPLATLCSGCLVANQLPMQRRDSSAVPAGKAAAAAAATAAYEDHLDQAVSLGWAFVERLCFEVLSLVLQPILAGTAPVCKDMQLWRTLIFMLWVRWTLMIAMSCGADVCSQARFRVVIPTSGMHSGRLSSMMLQTIQPAMQLS